MSERDLTRDFDNLMVMLVTKKVISVEDVRDICRWKKDLKKEFNNFITLLVDKKVINIEEISNIYGWKETKEFAKIREYIFSVVNKSIK